MRSRSRWRERYIYRERDDDICYRYFIIYFGFQFRFQSLSRSPFGHLPESVGSDAAVFPDAVVGAVRCADYVTKVRQPLVGREITRMRLAGPETLEHDLSPTKGYHNSKSPSLLPLPAAFPLLFARTHTDGRTGGRAS